MSLFLVFVADIFVEHIVETKGLCAMDKTKVKRAGQYLLFDPSETDFLT